MPTPKRRMPISCEPCRGRKIRCLRAKDSAGCCETCIRRGIPPSQCVFLGYHHHYFQPAGERSSEDPSNGELLARIRDLETLVRGQAANSPSPPIPSVHNGLTPSTQASSSRGPSSNGYKSETEEAAMPVQLTPPMHESSRPPQHVSYGTLSTSDRGHVQFNPHGSQWSSVLKDDSATVASVANFEYDDDESAADFPFTLASCTKPEDLLAALPPVRQCDALKDAYFDVFAPVSTAFLPCIQNLAGVLIFCRLAIPYPPQSNFPSRLYLFSKRARISSALLAGPLIRYSKYLSYRTGRQRPHSPRSWPEKDQRRKRFGVDASVQKRRHAVPFRGSLSFQA